MKKILYLAAWIVCAIVGGCSNDSAEVDEPATEDNGSDMLNYNPIKVGFFKMNGDWHENFAVTYDLKRSEVCYVGVICGSTKDEIDRFMPLALEDGYWLNTMPYMQPWGLGDPNYMVYFSKNTHYEILESELTQKIVVDNIMWDAYVTEYVAIPRDIYNQVCNFDDKAGTIEACNQYIRDGMPGATVYTFSLP